MNVLIVDDETLARRRLKALLEDLGEGPMRIMEAAAVAQAQEILERTEGNAAIDLVLLDIQMPGMDGVQFAQSLRARTRTPAVVFVTAHPEYAARAFDLEAADYLTKPVRSERLRQALKRARVWLGAHGGAVASPAPAVSASALVSPPVAPSVAASQNAAPTEYFSSTGTGEARAEVAPFLIVNSHNRTERILIDHIVFCRAEMKYITLVTAQGSALYDGSLSELEKLYPSHFVRVHRNALVARKALRGLIKAHTEQEGEHWRLQLLGTEETLQVSRRLLPSVRAELHGRGR